MWRSEERLEFWLAGGRPSRKKMRDAWLGMLPLRQSVDAVKELPLAIESGMASLDSELKICAGVQSGLDLLSEPADENGFPEPEERLWSAHMTTAAHGVALLGSAAVHRIPMPNPHRTRIRHERLIVSATPRSAVMSLDAANIGSVDPIQDRHVRMHDGAGLLLRQPSVRATAQIADLPHRQESADIGQLSDSERSSFLREAEIMKQIPFERAELVAVFRHVPIEVISRLRFLADLKELRYTIPCEPRRTQTRVHDMAVIRDSANQEIHLVPHRTNSRPVSLT